jgi:hypothetical protein
MKPSDLPRVPSSSPLYGFRPLSFGRPAALGAGLPTPPAWLWHGYLAPGQLTLLTSLWKSGKTTLLAILLARLKDGGQLLGLPVRAARALVVSEEDLMLWAGRSHRLVFGEHAGLISRPFDGKPTFAGWRTLIDRSADILGTEGGRLLVIDTVASHMPAGVETNADCMARALAPLRRLAEQGIAVWLMHHPHKGKARVGQWSRGTGSLPGRADIVLEMHLVRPADPYDRRRLLLAQSRHQETPRRLLIEWTPDGTDYRVLPDEPADDFDHGWSLIREVLSDFEAPATAAEILRSWPPDSPPPSRATLQRWLAQAVARGVVECEASGRRNEARRYWVADGEEG